MKRKLMYSAVLSASIFAITAGVDAQDWTDITPDGLNFTLNTKADSFVFKYEMQLAVQFYCSPCVFEHSGICTCNYFSTCTTDMWKV